MASLMVEVAFGNLALGCCQIRSLGIYLGVKRNRKVVSQ